MFGRKILTTIERIQKLRGDYWSKGVFCNEKRRI